MYPFPDLALPPELPGVNLSIQGFGSSAPYRGFAIMGSWREHTGDAYSREFRARLNGGTERTVGGWATAQDFELPPFGPTWNNNAPPQGVTSDTLVTGAPQDQLHVLQLRQFLIGTSARLERGRLALLTDAQPPQGGTLPVGAPTFRRAATLTTLAGTPTSEYRYVALPLNVASDGLYLIGAMYGPSATGGASWDGFLHLYDGVFNPANALANLVGLDDDGSTGLNASAIWIELRSGVSYTLVVTTFSSGATSPAQVGDFTFYLAGGAYPPGACCLPGGVCVISAHGAECASLGGIWQGRETQCADVPCPSGFGACCLSAAVCVEMDGFQCAQQGNYFKGSGTLCSGDPAHIQLSEGMGVAFRRLDFTFQLAPQPNSSTGLMSVSFAALAAATGLQTGFVNVYSAQGWVVRNTLFDVTTGDEGTSTLFDIGPYSGSGTLNAYVTAGAQPSFCFSGPLTARLSFVAPPLPWNAEGGGAPRTGVPRPPDVSPVEFENVGPGLGPRFGYRVRQKINFETTPNIHQDQNQCAPASVANSLGWLGDTYGVAIPDAHTEGIRDGSLVGELDKKMNRPAHGGVGSAVEFLNGKLDYIDSERLADQLHIKHKQAPGVDWIDGDRSVGDATSHVNTDPNVSLWEWIAGEIEAGEDVEVRIGWFDPNDPEVTGGHYMRITGCGKLFGIPYLEWIHDAAQGFDPNDPTKVDKTNGGTSPETGGHGSSFVIDNIILCFIAGATDSATIDYAVSESPIYPATTVLNNLGPRWAKSAGPLTPMHFVSRSRQYTATRYRASQGFVESGTLANLYDAPAWIDNTHLQIDNVAVSTHVKEVHLNLVFTATQFGIPGVSIVTASGQSPIYTKFQWSDNRTNLLVSFLLPDQPEWEQLVFANANIRNFVGLKRMGIASYCQRRPDANNNGIDDRVEILQNPSLDQNQDGIIDEIHLSDCNFNGTPDYVDVAIGIEADCDENGRPDSCDLLVDADVDCNGNGWLDSCETNALPATDLNGNRIPDSCEGPALCPGDVNCSGAVDFDDIDLLVEALGYPGGAGWPYPDCPWLNADCDGNANVDFDDIDPFVALIGTACP
ncbi:MAG: hypothetical protein IPM13_10085 [Phycisphaerales bacterium]|nr:hypothetical protein [Phycisphaerales bacterium]